MKRSMYILMTILVILSMTMIAANTPPGAKEKHPDKFTATEKCVVVKQGEKIEQDGWVYYRDQELKCTFVSKDDQVSGSVKLMILPPKVKAFGHQHTVVGHFHLSSAYHDWVGYQWGKIAKDGTITWVNGWAWTPEQGSYLRHAMWMRFAGANVEGWYEEMGMN